MANNVGVGNSNHRPDESEIRKESRFIPSIPCTSSWAKGAKVGLLEKRGPELSQMNKAGSNLESRFGQPARSLLSVLILGWCKRGLNRQQRGAGSSPGSGLAAKPPAGRSDLKDKYTRGERSPCNATATARKRNRAKPDFPQVPVIGKRTQLTMPPLAQR